MQVFTNSWISLELPHCHSLKQFHTREQPQELLLATAYIKFDNIHKTDKIVLLINHSDEW